MHTALDPIVLGGEPINAQAHIPLAMVIDIVMVGINSRASRRARARPNKRHWMWLVEREREAEECVWEVREGFESMSAMAVGFGDHTRALTGGAMGA